MGEYFTYNDSMGLGLTQINECQALLHLTYCCEAHSQLVELVVKMFFGRLTCD